jgi:hypothetical protein
MNKKLTPKQLADLRAHFRKEFAAEAGRTKSKAKAAASRRNGKLGGRPKKTIDNPSS